MIRTAARTLRRAVSRPWHALQNAWDSPVLVLMYHRIVRLDRDPQLLAVSPENFRAHVAYLKDRYPILRFEADWSSRRGRAVVITFDDGYADNLHAAVPVLEAAGAPATFFVASGYVGNTREYWSNEVARLLLESSTAEPLTLGIGTWAMSSPALREEGYRAVHDRLKTLSAEGRERQLEAIRRWAHVSPAPPEGRAWMTVADVQALARQPLATIGSHTVNHPSLARIPLDSQEQELREAKASLEAWTGRTVDTLAYPYGGPRDVSGRTMAICRRLGYRKAAANIHGQAHRWTNPLRIPRVIVRDWGAAEFAARLEAFWT